jgi:hypothetical protein
MGTWEHHQSETGPASQYHRRWAPSAFTGTGEGCPSRKPLLAPAGREAIASLVRKTDRGRADKIRVKKILENLSVAVQPARPCFQSVTRRRPETKPIGIENPFLRVEYLAIYKTPAGDCVSLPVVKDSSRAYRLLSERGFLRITYYLDGGLEFQNFTLSDSVIYQRNQAEKFMRMILTAPARPAAYPQSEPEFRNSQNGQGEGNVSEQQR